MNALSKYANQINTSINKDLATGNQEMSVGMIEKTQAHTNTHTPTELEEKQEKQEKQENIMQSEKTMENFENTHPDILDLPIDEGFITGLDD